MIFHPGDRVDCIGATGTDLVYGRYTVVKQVGLILYLQEIAGGWFIWRFAPVMSRRPYFVLDGADQ